VITEKDLQEAIAECQGTRTPNSNTCIKLAAYYTLMDHLYGRAEEVSSYSYAAGPESKMVEYNSDSEFAKIIRGKDINEVLSIIDELMDTLNVINPRLYEGVITKLLI
jgi:hypothetical protein